MMTILYGIMGTFAVVMLLLGIHAQWTLRDDGKFSIEEGENVVTLWYNHRGEWIANSTHATIEEARAQIEHYTTTPRLV